jgi:hypothetical protein
MDQIGGHEHISLAPAVTLRRRFVTAQFDRKRAAHLFNGARDDNGSAGNAALHNGETVATGKICHSVEILLCRAIAGREILP